MSIENVIKKLQIIVKEKEAERSEHRQRQEEEIKLLRKTEIKDQLKKIER
jgi:hypothetical protein